MQAVNPNPMPNINNNPPNTAVIWGDEDLEM